MEKSDEEIIGQVLGGHKQAYSILIKRYQRQIFNLMFRYSRSQNDAADLTQEVFLRAYEKLNSFRSEYRFFTWLYTLAVNMANDWARKKTRLLQHQEQMADRMVYPDAAGFRQEKILENREDLRQLQKAVDMLADDTREILLLRYHEECSVKEVARIFSISESAVKMRTARGLRQLQEIMREAVYGTAKI
ncbi:MAG: RNA polymerase sigma factor [Desulfobulbaceae bacterium]|nr:RNA polymerase sigma factor [Desulfobulbaceae bacterium]